MQMDHIQQVIVMGNAQLLQFQDILVARVYVCLLAMEPILLVIVMGNVVQHQHKNILVNLDE